MEIIIFIAVVVILYLLNKDYDASAYQIIKVNSKQDLKGKLEDHEAGLLISLMAKVAKADGNISDLEAELLSLTFTDISLVFNDNENIRVQLKEIYNKEKDFFENTIEISEKYYKLTKNNYQKRLKVMEYLLNLAFIDGDYSSAEAMIIEDIANSIQIEKSDLNNIINKFKAHYEAVKNNSKMNIDKAYLTLESNSNMSDTELKKQYRALVKQHHPDIVTGKGADQSTIDEATTKLQEINEAYDIIKKERK